MTGNKNVELICRNDEHGTLHCKVCNEDYDYKLPMDVDRWSTLLKTFSKKHLHKEGENATTNKE